MKTLTPVLVITISIGMYFMYISPTVDEVRALLAKKQEYDNVLQKAQELIAQRDAILTDYNSIPSSDIEKLNKMLPETMDDTAFLNELNVLAVQKGLAVQSFQKVSGGNNGVVDVSEDAINLPYITNKFSMSLSGSYDQFNSFLKDIESNLRLTDITSITAKSIELQTGPSGSMEYLLEISAYSLR